MEDLFVVVQNGIFDRCAGFAQGFGELRPGFAGTDAQDFFAGVDGFSGEFDECVGAVVRFRLGIDSDAIF